MEVIDKKTSTETIEGIHKAIHEINESRVDYLRQAMVNVLFLYGKQHFTISNRSVGDATIGQRLVWELENNKGNADIRRVCNIILPPFRSLYSRLIRMKGNVHAVPTTSTQKDRDAARVSKEVAEEFWQTCNRNNPWLVDEYTGMQAVLMKLDLYALSIGMGYLIPYFNPRSKSFVYDQRTREIFEADVGEVEVRVASPLNVFKDTFNRFAIERQFLSPEQIEEEFNIKPDPSKVDEEATELKITRALEGLSAEKMEKDGVYIYRKYCVPTKEYPDGRMIICTDKEIIADTVLPQEYKKRKPVYEFRYQDLGFTNYGQGAVEQVIDLQKDYNYTLSRIAAHKKLFGGKILSPRGAKLSAKYDDVTGQIINYTLGYKPTVEPSPPVSQYYYQELERIEAKVENLMNIHDSSMGRTPGQVKSGVGIASLSSLDDAQIAPEMIMFEQKLGFFMETVLDLIQEKYNEQRLLSISGDDLAYEIKSFIGSDLFGRKRIQVRLGSNFPLDKTERTNYILMLKKEGFISPERAKEILEFDDIDGAFKSLDETEAKQDILNIIEGTMQVVAEPHEDHTIFLKVINDFRKGSVYQKLDPMIRQRIGDWARQHEEMLLNEQAAAGQMGAPLPPSAAPQNQGAR